MQSYEVIIVGAGPAGLSAGIYSVRNGLRTIIIDQGMGGGGVANAPQIENYLGFESIKGMELAEKFKGHASKYVDIHEGEQVTDIETDIDKAQEPGFIVTTDQAKYKAGALILATGTTHRKLGVNGEEEFAGRGVSYCATCDGFFFKGKKVLVVGGGNSAVIDAIHLHDLGCKVTLIHRRDELRAEKSLQKGLFDRGIEVVWNSILEEIKGGNVVTGASIRTKTGDGSNENNSSQLSDLKFDGVFISIGETPNSQLAKALGLNLDGRGYIMTDKRQCTNIPKVYAAGDITGGVKQIIVACGEGAIAAISAYEDLKNPYWVKKIA